MNGHDKRRVALVTGTSGDIGAAIATMLTQEGHTVVSTSRTRSGRGGTEWRPCDLTENGAVRDLVDGISKTHGRIDVVVHCAGAMKPALLTDTSDALWHELVSSNLTSTFLLLRAVLPAMVAQKWGRFVAISSISGKTGDPNFAAYSATKHGVLGLIRSTALQVAMRGVTVNAVCPGAVETEGTRQAIESWARAEGRQADTARYILESFSPQNRLFETHELQAAVKLLLSEDAKGINGQSLNICGGTSFY